MNKYNDKINPMTRLSNIFEQHLTSCGREKLPRSKI